MPPHVELMMPSLSPTMTQGNIASWAKKEGESFAAGDVLAEVETDKATMSWEAQDEGVIAKILLPAGSKDIPVGTLVAVVVDDAESVAAFKDYAPGGSSTGAAAPAPPTSQPPPKAPSSGSSFPPHQVLNMPALSPTMTQGNISAWNKNVGDAVAAGDVLCEVETDKATMAWESQDEGFLAQILLPGGSKDVPVGTPAAVIVDDKEMVAAFSSFSPADVGGAPAAAPAAAAPEPPKAAAPATAAPAPKPAAKPAPAAAAPGARVIASPYARKLAAEASVSLAGISGTGPGGRIVAADVEAAIRSGKAAPAGASAGAPAATPSTGTWTDIDISQIKRVTASRLLQSKQEIPHYYVTQEVAVDSLLALREQVNASLAAAGAGKLSVNDFIIKAAALALKKVPAINSSWRGDVIREYSNVDINVAVQTPIGLMVPFVKDADKKSLLTISTEVKELAAKAKEGKLKPEEFTGGTFTISNLGMFGVKQFCAIVNPPQAAILAVGGSQSKVVKTADGKFVTAQTLNVTLSLDHRVVDGALGAQWLQAFKAYVESPLTMVV